MENTMSEEVGQTPTKCPECGDEVDEHGEALNIFSCGYCCVECDTCGSETCDNSC